jgi:hypothetical protein
MASFISLMLFAWKIFNANVFNGDSRLDVLFEHIAL